MPNCPYTKLEVAQDLRRVRFHSAQTTANVPQTTANECDPTFAEECVGKAKFYSFLYREFDLWYSAFEVEAEEQGGMLKREYRHRYIQTNRHKPKRMYIYRWLR